MNNLKRFLALMLALSMMLTVVPFGAFATESEEQTSEPTESVTDVPGSDVEALADDAAATTALTLGDKPADGTVTGQPFNPNVSANYRIPGLVNHNGTLIASADARWDYEKDGGGMDLVVSRSEDGNTWNYTFAGYLGDNGNVWNADSSTLMDPVIISDGNTLYLLADMFPAGYSISSSSTTNVFSDTAIGFDTNGNLLLSKDGRSTYGYYLKDGKIYATDGTVQSTYTVDSWFNLSQNGTYVTNLFFSDSPFQVRATSYICLLTSTDGGETWNNNGLLNVKPSGVEWMVLGPGSGVVTQDGNLAFTAYDNSNIYLVYGKDGQWNTVQTSAATNESSIIELNDGTIRAFVKRGGNNTIAYVDFARNDNGSYITYTAGNLVDTGVTNFSQCMVSSLHYSKTLNGKEVVLVCCPSKPGAGDWNGRFNGKIHMFTLDGSNNMTLVNSYALNSESQFFAYSNMAELDDGTIGVLYEDDCISYSAGSYYGNASHITYTNVNLETAFGVTFDIMYKDVAWNADSAAGSVEVPVSSGVTSVYAQQAEVSSLTSSYVAYDMHLCGTTDCTGTCGNAYTGAATVTLPLTEELKNASALQGFVVEEDGTITYVDDVQTNGDTATFVAPHFSVVGVTALADDSVDNVTVDITLYEGNSKTVTIDGYSYGNTNVTESPKSSVATLDKVEGKEIAAEKKLVAVTEIESGKQYLLFNNRAGKTLTNTTNSPGLLLDGAATADSTHLWTINVSSTSDSTYYCTVRYGTDGGYLNVRYGSASVNDDAVTLQLDYIEDSDHWLINDYQGWYGLNDYTGAKTIAAGWSDASTDSGSWWTIYEIVETEAATYTEVTFTGVTEGNTTATIGHVTYNITVEKVTTGDISDFNNIVGKGTYSDNNTVNPSARSDLDMTGKVIKSLRITEGASFLLDVDVKEYDSIIWSTVNSSVATVDENGNVTAVAAGETDVIATVIKNGVEESISIKVTVVPSLLGENSGETSFIFYYIEQVDYTDPYYTMFLSTADDTYPVDGHKFIKVSEGEVIWYERPTDSAFAWLWTADPWEGYALTYMASTGSVSQYYPLKDTESDELQLGESDYGSTTAQNPGPYYKYSISYKNIESVGNDDGASWRSQLDAVLGEAIVIGRDTWDNYGCDGAMSNTRWDHDRVPDLVTSMTFISDPMPQITKKVNGILPTTKKRADFREYKDGMTATVDEYVYFQIDITVDRPTVWVKDSEGNDTTTGAINYTNAIVTDTALKNGYFYVQANDTNMNGVIDGDEGQQLQTSDITDQLNAAWGTNEQTRTISLYLVYKIVSDDIPRFNITNTADLAWNYQSTYSTGALSGKADAEATITVVGHTMDNVVIDFGQSFTYTGLNEDHLKYAYVGADAKYTAKYGTVTVTGSGTTTQDDIGTYYSEYVVTYTPTTILQTHDIVSIYGLGENGEKVINSFLVYPATTVYYEEGFMQNELQESGIVNTNKGWSDGALATMDQEFEKLNEAVYDSEGTLTGYASDKTHPYGYDPIYNGDGTNDVAKSYISSRNVGDTTSFQFTGTGFELYANSTTGTGRVAVSVYNAAGTLEMMYVVNTVAANGTSDATNGQATDLNSLPIVSVKNMTHGTYTVTLTKVVNDSKPVYIDGVRIINTVKDSTVFQIDLEDNPEFYQLRDYVLNAVGVDDVTESMYTELQGKPGIAQIAEQIYKDVTPGETTVPAIVLAENGNPYDEYSVQDLLDNGPKNELYLHEGETLTFKVSTNRMMQIGLKAPQGQAKYSLKYSVDGNETEVASEKDLKTPVDMFYALGNSNGTEKEYTITITNNSGMIDESDETKYILSVTDLKICDDPNAVFVPLTVEDIKATLVTMGYGVAENTTTGESFETVSAALAAAKDGETVKLLADCTETNLMVTAGVTLDLNGFNLTASYVVAFDSAHVVDNAGGGSLAVGIKNLVLDEENAMIAVYTGEGYVFTKAGFAIRQNTGYTGEGIKIDAMAYPLDMNVVDQLKNGAADNNIEIIIRLTWDTDQGTGSQDFKFNDDVVASVYSSNNGSWNSYDKMFSMVVTGFQNIENLKANIIVVSGTNAEYVSSKTVDIT